MTIKEKVTEIWNSFKDTEKPSAAEIQRLLIKENFNASSSRVREIVAELKITKDSYLEKISEETGIPESTIDRYWIKDKEKSVLVVPGKVNEVITPDLIKEVITDVITNTKILPYQVDPSPELNTEEVLRIILTDIHVGMETDEHGYGLYSEVWNEEELFKRLEIVLEECKRIKRNFKEVHIIDLGDFMDGWSGNTTRGGHKLPQNMSNRKAYQVGVKFKVELYNRIQSLFNTKVVCYNVCNDNHSSDFGFIVNETARQILEISNPNIEVNNIQRFIYHYYIGDHCFILSHGKDEVHMKHGFKCKLDPLTKDKIQQYIKNYNIKAKYITFEKGDSHLQLLDSTSSQDFEYNNYRAFSPASGWVTHNFSKSTSGFTFMTVRPDKKSKGIEAIEF